MAVVPRPDSPGIPTKLLNYMAAGNAIVSFKQSATILQHRETAFLVEPATAENFAQGILSLSRRPNSGATASCQREELRDGAL